MGCATSKQARCKHCQSPYSPVRRSYSMHVHRPPQVQGDTYHVVALTSTTMGSLMLETAIDKNLHQSRVNGYATMIADGDTKPGVEFSMGVIEARTWSDMIDEKVPKVKPRTPIRTPPGEPETIDAWEMMEGLEDLSPLRPSNGHRSFSFDVSRNHCRDPFERPGSRFQGNGSGPSSMENDSCSKLCENDQNSPKQMWHQMENGNLNSNLDLNSIVSDFDPDVISTFRKSLQGLSPENPFCIRGSLNEEKPSITTTTTLNTTTLDVTEKVIIYFTSLRGVRKTYEDCCLVRVILKGLNVRVDERDVSMHSGFKEELKELLGDLISGAGLNLPRVFVGQKYIGGAEEIRRLNEEGHLEKVLECCKNFSHDRDADEDGRSRTCEACGDVRFVPCETCSGSCKIYYEGGSDYESEDEDEEEDEEKDEYDDEEKERGDIEYGFRRCPNCNENGLIRCPICCD